METVEQRFVEELTASEKLKLQAAIKGYGKLKKAGNDSGVHFQTVKNVANLGRGEKSTIEKLRKAILAA